MRDGGQLSPDWQPGFNRLSQSDQTYGPDISFQNVFQWLEQNGRYWHDRRR
jgi:hypothetical protein